MAGSHSTAPQQIHPNPNTPGRRMTGAIPTPRHRLASAPRFFPSKAQPLGQTAWVPERLSMWDNDHDGDCVTAEEAFAKGARSPPGFDGVFVPDAEVIRWASAGGFLNGAMLDEVMDAMARDGFHVGGQVYGDGPYATVDYSSEPVLQTALDIGPVKIGIDAGALPEGAGMVQGWTATGGRPHEFRNEDHCVSLAGYGPASFLFAALGLAVPSGMPATTPGYLLFTWSTIGFVDHKWIMSTCGEAWLRSPTNTGGGGGGGGGATLNVVDALVPGVYNVTRAADTKK